MASPRNIPPATRSETEAADRLRRSEARFRVVFDHAPVGILVLGPDMRVQQANHAILSMLGYDEAEMIGRDVREFIHADDHAESDRARERVVSGTVDSLVIERRAVRRDGGVLILQVQSSVLRSSTGTLELVITQAVDATKQRERETRLLDSEARLRTIFEEAPIGMALIAPAGELLQVNRALATMLGRPAEELQRMSVPELLHPDELTPTRALVEAALDGGAGTLRAETRYVKPDGSIVWGAVQSTLVHDAAGRPSYFVSQVVDISERKLAEDALRESEARYRGLVENSQDLIVRMDLDGNLTFVNDAWCAKFGLRRDQAMGHSVMPRIVPTDQALAADTLRGLTRPPHRARVEIRQQSVEGLRWMEWEGCGVFDEHGTVIELQAIGRDVTHAHEVDEALRASEARYRGVVESQEAVVLRMDLGRRITFVNDYGSRILGLPRETMIGMDVLAWVYEPDRAAVQEAFASEFEPPHRARTECRVSIGSELRWFDWEGTVIFAEDGRPIELQSVGFDVTERHVAADRLRASLEELRQSEEKLRLLAQRQTAVREEERKRVGFDLHDGVCQELIGIGILVESIRTRHAAALGASDGDMSRVTSYLSEVVEHLRLLAGELRPMLLHDLGLEGSLRSLAFGLASEGTTIHTSFPTGIPRLDEGAEVGVYRIAQEALTNALRHARAARVDLTVTIEENHLRLAVQDDGCGFDPTRRRTAALGLLSMHERALAFGGRLEIVSAPERGTTVVLDCPLGARRITAEV